MKVTTKAMEFLCGILILSIIILSIVSIIKCSSPEIFEEPIFTPQEEREIKESYRKESKLKHDQSFKSWREDTLK